MAKKNKKMLKGNRLWAIGYALTSLKIYKVRNIGIALILAISIAIPTAIFAWTDTGTRLTVEDYFDNNAYQISVQNVPDNSDYSHLFDAQEQITNSPYIEYAHIVPSTVGILRLDGITSEWNEYRKTSRNYLFGIKDTRVIAVTPDNLDVWSSELDYTGNFSLTSGQIIVSQIFIDTTMEALGISLQIDSVIGVDVLRNRYEPSGARPFDPLILDRQIVRNLTIVGIFEVTRPSVVSQSFPGISRNNWDPLGIPAPVLGLADSILMLTDDLGEDTVDKISMQGFFSPVGLVRGSAQGLLDAGPMNAAVNMLSVKTQIQESDDQLSVLGLDNIAHLQTHISTFLASQVLIILALPIMVMSLMLTIFTSETSVSLKKGEVSALRAKGASFNQIISAFTWESLILALLGLALGIGLTIIMAPLMGSSTGLLTFDIEMYGIFLSKLQIPLQSLVLAAVIAIFLPAAYLFHVSRRIDITEIGQPTIKNTYEIPEEVSFKYYAFGLAVVMVVLLVMPILVIPSGQNALIEILIATAILFAASYLGSRAMRLVTADVSERVTSILDEKKLYLTQSLRRRKGQFIPLLVILTLTLTTTTMMLIQTASFKDTLTNEANYAMGADVRIKSDHMPFDWVDTLTGYTGVEAVTPIIESLSFVETEGFYVEGLDIGVYRDIGDFKQSSFVGVSSDEILTTLEATPNGIIISEFYGTFWNVSVGDSLEILCTAQSGVMDIVFEIVGFMKSAPGFGMASTRDLAGTPYGAYFDFHPGRGGFALTNLDFFISETRFTTTRVFLAGVTSIDEASAFIEFLENRPWTDVYTEDSIEFGPDTVTGLFLAGIEGLTMISFILCAAMGISSIALFLGSAVLEREPEYALFRAIGGTKKQIASLVFGEFAGSVMAAVLLSLALGVVFGYTATLLTFGISSIWPILGKVLTYPLNVMFLTVALECVVMVIACYYPARRAGNTNPAEVLRNM
ncbi:MAG: FtsX-like permease family protein [Candidatus Thorarchaeota archaeon]|nr:FtsX-like permease family protein [Candidatus Thorarchaeota archaeon]